MSLNNTGRFFIIIGSIIGVIAAIIWPLHKHAENSIASNVAPTPIISLDEAQRQVLFTIHVPTTLPQGYRLIGVRVFQLKSLDTDADILSRRQARRQHVGYGLLVLPPNQAGKPFMVHATPGSPAEQQGVSSDHADELIAINGIKIVTLSSGKSNLPDIRSISAPLRITLKNSAGQIRDVTLSWTGQFYVGGGPSLPNDKRAALLYASPNGSLAIVESMSSTDSMPTYMGGSSTSTINGSNVTFYGSKYNPDATFVRGTIKYDIANDKGNLNQAQIEQLIQNL